jgi:hypothetical protein
MLDDLKVKKMLIQLPKCENLCKMSQQELNEVKVLDMNKYLYLCCFLKNKKPGIL